MYSETVTESKKQRTSSGASEDINVWSRAYLNKDEELRKERATKDTALKALQEMHDAETSRKHKEEMLAAVAERKRLSDEIEELKKCIAEQNESKSLNRDGQAELHSETKLKKEGQ